MYITFHYLTVLCVSATEHVYDISLPDSVVCVCYRICMTSHCLTVMCVHTAYKRVYDISLPDLFVCVYYIQNMYDVSLPDSFVYMSITEHVPNNSRYCT